MKKFIFAAFIALATTVMATAQNERGERGNRMSPKQRTEQRINRMDKELKLSDNQKKQIRTYFADFNKKKLRGEERKTGMKQLNEQIMSVLNAEQQKGYKKMQKEMDERRKERKGKPAHAEHPSVVESSNS